MNDLAGGLTMLSIHKKHLSCHVTIQNIIYDVSLKKDSILNPQNPLESKKTKILIIKTIEFLFLLIIHYF